MEHGNMALEQSKPLIRRWVDGLRSSISHQYPDEGR